MSNRNSITSKQLMLFIISAQLGLGIIILPAQLAHEVGHDGWITVIAGGLLSTFVLIFIILLLKRYSDKSILQINKLLYGKYIGSLFNILLLLFLYYSSVLALRVFGEVIKLTVLRMTPPIILAAFILIPTMYLTWYGLKPTVRFANIMIFIILVELIFFTLILKNIKITFLMPIGEKGIVPIIKSTYITIVTYLGFELTSFIYPEIKDKNKVMKYTIFANIISTMVFTIVVLVTTGLFGENMLEKLTFPLFALVRTYRAPVIERLDLFFIALWFPAMACTMRAYFLTTYYSINKLFEIKNKKIFFTLFIAATILLSRVPKDYLEVIKYEGILGIAGTGVFIFFVISFIFSFINKRGVKGR